MGCSCCRWRLYGWAGLNACLMLQCWAQLKHRPADTNGSQNQSSSKSRSHLKSLLMTFIDASVFICYCGFVSDSAGVPQCASSSRTGASENICSMKPRLTAGFCSRVDEHELITTATRSEWSSKWHPGLRWKPCGGYKMHNAFWQPVVKQE